VTADDRLPPIPPKKQTEAQREASTQFLTERDQDVFGPFVPLSRSPQLMMHASRMGQYLRYGSSLPRDVSEFAILLQSRRWSQPYEWYVHAPDAKRAGLSDAIVDAIAAGRRPDNLPERLQVVYDFCTELNGHGGVTDDTYARAVTTFGEQGMMDLIGMNGYYAFIAMVLNVARTPLPPGHEPPFQSPSS
jgi:4-carboxymuconolactone decarboxylase